MNEFDEEFTEYMNMIAQAYEDHSIIPYVTRNRVFNEVADRDLRLMDISISELVPIEWFEDPAICPEPFLYDIGRSIAIGEEKYLIRTTIEKAKTEPISISEIRPSQILDIAREFIREGYSEPILFVPAELSVPLYIEAQGVEFVDNREFLRISPTERVPLFLTSKYVEVNDLLLVDKSLGIWIFEQGNFSERLTIKGTLMQYENIRILAKTRMTYNVERPEAVRVLRTAHML